MAGLVAFAANAAAAAVASNGSTQIHSFLILDFHLSVGRFECQTQILAPGDPAFTGGGFKGF